MLIDGFEIFQKNFELSDEEIDTLKITFIKEIIANSKFLLYTIFCGFIGLILKKRRLRFSEKLKSFVMIILEMVAI